MPNYFFKSFLQNLSNDNKVADRVLGTKCNKRTFCVTGPQASVQCGTNFTNTNRSTAKQQDGSALIVASTTASYAASVPHQWTPWKNSPLLRPCPVDISNHSWVKPVQHWLELTGRPQMDPAAHNNSRYCNNNHNNSNNTEMVDVSSLQFCDTVGWATGRASGL